MTKLAVDMQKITVRFGKVIANNEVDFQAEWARYTDWWEKTAPVKRR